MTIDHTETHDMSTPDTTAIAEAILPHVRAVHALDPVERQHEIAQALAESGAFAIHAGQLGFSGIPEHAATARRISFATSHRLASHVGIGEHSAAHRTATQLRALGLSLEHNGGSSLGERLDPSQFDTATLSQMLDGGGR